jgi:hypothetical protein
VLVQRFMQVGSSVNVMHYVSPIACVFVALLSLVVELPDFIESQKARRDRFSSTRASHKVQRATRNV